MSSILFFSFLALSSNTIILTSDIAVGTILVTSKPQDGGRLSLTSPFLSLRIAYETNIGEGPRAQGLTTSKIVLGEPKHSRMKAGVTRSFQECNICTSLAFSIGTTRSQ